MRRNRFFEPSREPFRNTNRLALEDSRTIGPFSFFNPTRAYFQPTKLAKDQEKSQGEVSYQWRSRDNRKGRHALRIPASAAQLQHGDVHLPRATNSISAVSRGIIRMFTVFPYWDISYLIAVIFTLGSVVWVINGFFSFMPQADPKSEFSGEVYYGGGITAFIGAIIFFETGSILLMFEAVNENHTGCFGWALEQLYTESGSRLQLLAKDDECRHHHKNTGNFVGRSRANAATTEDSISSADKGNSSPSLSATENNNTATTDANSSSPTISPPQQQQQQQQQQYGQQEEDNPTGPNATTPSQNGGVGNTTATWQWFPTIRALQTHYLRELGFLASFSQFLGATIFGIAGFTSLPGIYNRIENHQRLLDGVYWIPQVIGGSGFIISGTLYMLETQRAWYIPAYDVLGWHIGFWNLVGAIGFTMCGALGMAYGSSGAQYEASLATFWGSWAFLLGSALQWYESLDKYPVEIEPSSSSTPSPS